MKVVLVGSAKSGKTKLTRAVKQQRWDTYIPTIGVEVCSVKYKGKNFDLWDTAGDVRYGGLRDGYWISADKFIVLDSKDRWSYWKSQIDKMFDNIPIIYTETPDVSIFDSV